ncbi:MAG: copper chaperone PCu(A)C [Rhodobacterales bacterium]|nr:copper chaperone PCu(A)C [Rhodobacterales bacterium]
MSFTFRTLATTAAIAFALPAAAQNIEVTGVYARSASPNAETGAVFMQIVNNGEAADRLIDVASPAADLVQLHTHSEGDDGVMKMEHVEEGFEVPAGGTLTLERGGKHVMLMGLNSPLKQDEMVPITLTFEKEGDMALEVPVDLDRKPGDSMEMDHEMDHDMEHDDHATDSE